jgi:hypothetical protein
MREREHVRLPMPERRLDRALLGLGAAALVAVIPMLWMWLRYASGAPRPGIYAGGVGLAAITVAIGWAMLRILDGIR